VSSRLIIIGLLSVLILFVPSKATESKITGTITDSIGTPLPGATVFLSCDDQFHSGTMSDTNGNFAITYNNTSCSTSTIKISSIGYLTLEKNINPENASNMTFALKEAPIEMASISVSPRPEIRYEEVNLNSRKIEERARKTLIPTNPIGAIKQPQVVREGSNHSSKIRSNGSSPIYFINGMEIGYDPNHYGMFSIIPGSIVDAVKFYPQGTDASFGLPASIELSTPTPFNKHFNGDINLSSVEATASASWGNDNYFILGSLRKSVLDKLVKQIDVHSDRMTIPPTNFQDVYLSSGVQLDQTSRIIIDQYYVRDYLSYNASSFTSGSGSINTSQHTSESFIGARLEILNENSFYRINGAIRSSYETYAAFPPDNKKRSAFNVDLTADRTVFLAGVEANFTLKDAQLTIGNNLQAINKREIELKHTNWNFLPPDTKSDRPYVYQNELNRFYGNLHHNNDEINNAGYISYRQNIGDLVLESGFRMEYFGNLYDRIHPVYRHSVQFRISPETDLNFYYGTFVENPINRILEPYQVLIHSQVDRLKPIATELATASLNYNDFKFSIFRKKIEQLPALVPDFNRLKDGLPQDERFLAVESIGEAYFLGGDITFEKEKFLSPKFDLYAFYGYTHAEQVKDGATIPYDINARHKFFMQLSYRMNSTVKFGFDLAARSGYPYSPSRILSNPDNLSDKYTEKYYRRELHQENSLEFPMSASLNFHIGLNFGSTECYLSISNFTNRENAIINTADGFIYDAGILPTMGIKYSF